MSYKQAQQTARSATKRIVSNVEGSKTALHNEDGSLTVKGIETLYRALQSPAEHHTVDLGVSAFKRFLNTIPMLTKGQRSEQIKKYKKQARAEYAEIIAFKGSFPTMPV